MNKIQEMQENDLFQMNMPTHIEVSWQELYTQCTLMFDNLLYSDLYALLGIPSYNIFLRRKAKIQLQSLFLALWHLTLENTFTEKAPEFFRKSLDTFIEDKRITEEIKIQYHEYWDSLQEKKDADFSNPAEYLKKSLVLKGKQIHTIAIALYIRTLYQYIQEHCVDLS